MFDNQRLWINRRKTTRTALVATTAWFVGWTVFLLLAGIINAKAAGPTMYCFESDADDFAQRNQWTHHSIVLWGSPPKTSANGTAYIALHGYGYDDAPTPRGSTDLVPISGGAVKDRDGTWIVSLTGTLLQYSTVGMFSASDGQPAYYIISLWWQIGIDLFGYGHVGNVTAGLSPHIPGAVDDSYRTIVWPVDCEWLR